VKRHSHLMRLTKVRCTRREDASEIQKAKINNVMERLRSRLPPLKNAQLSHFDSYGLLDLYNHHIVSDSVRSVVSKTGTCGVGEPLKGHF
jgi:hypothetical protein